jgi:hypothetical protein
MIGLNFVIVDITQWPKPWGMTPGPLSSVLHSAASALAPRADLPAGVLAGEPRRDVLAAARSPHPSKKENDS